MLMIFTPIVAQSSVEASLTIMFTIPDCEPPVEPTPAPELLPHATENKGIAAATNPINIRDTLDFILVSCEDSMVSTRLFELTPDIRAQGPRRPVTNSVQQPTKPGIGNRVAVK